MLQVSAAQSPAIVGQSVLYTLTIGNTGSVAVKGVNLLFRVPKGLEFYYTGALPASSACGNGYCSENEEATWDLGEIPAGAVKSIQLQAWVQNNVGAGDSIAPQVRLSATGLDSLTLSPSLPVAANAPVEVTLGSNADPALPGEEVELSIDVGHIGDASLFTGRLTLELPGWLAVTDVSDGGVHAAKDGVESVDWSIDTLPVGSSFRRLVKAKVAANAKAGSVLRPRVRFSYEDAELESTSALPIGVIGKASPLELAVVAAVDPVAPGAAETYLVTVSNPSLRAVDGVTLYQRVPADLASYYTLAEPDSSACGNGWCENGELAVWSLGTLQAGTSETITISPSVQSQVAGDGSLVTSLFQLDAIGVNSLHRFKTIVAHAKPAAQLVLGTALTPAAPGQSIVYDVDVGQIGPGSLQNSVLTLELPPEVTPKTPSNGGTITNGIATWDLGAIAVAQTLHRSLEVQISADAVAGSLLAARATLNFKGGQERDAVSEFALPLVAEPLPLSVKQAATPNPIVLGGTVSFTTTIQNTAARTIDGVNLLMRMPLGHTFYYTTGADPDSSACGNGWCENGEEAVWALGSLAAGSTKIVNVNPTADAALTAGSLATFRQRLTAVDLGGSIMLQSTLPTKK